jgi:hypothetical protein
VVGRGAVVVVVEGGDGVTIRCTGMVVVVVVVLVVVVVVVVMLVT